MAADTPFTFRVLEFCPPPSRLLARVFVSLSLNRLPLWTAPPFSFFPWDPPLSQTGSGLYDPRKFDWPGFLFLMLVENRLASFLFPLSSFFPFPPPSEFSGFIPLAARRSIRVLLFFELIVFTNQASRPAIFLRCGRSCLRAPLPVSPKEQICRARTRDSARLVGPPPADLFPFLLAARPVKSWYRS